MLNSGNDSMVFSAFPCDALLLIFIYCRRIVRLTWGQPITRRKCHRAVLNLAQGAIRSVDAPAEEGIGVAEQITRTPLGSAIDSPQATFSAQSP